VGLKIAQCSEAVIEGLKLLGVEVACFCMNTNLEMVGNMVTLLNTVCVCVSLIIHSCVSLSMALPELCCSV